MALYQDYVVSVIKGQGMHPIHKRDMSTFALGQNAQFKNEVTASGYAYSPNEPGAAIYESAATNIGFNFPFDESEYPTMYVNAENVCLVNTPSDFTPMYIDSSAYKYNNYGYYDYSQVWHKFTNHNVTLLPWNGNLRTTMNASLPDNDFYIQNTSGNDALVRKRFLLGCQNWNPKQESLLIPTDSDAYLSKYPGPRYAQDYHKNYGKCTIIRFGWINMPGSVNTEVAEYDIILYENGRIEYRYPANGIGHFYKNSGSPIFYDPFCTIVPPIIDGLGYEYNTDDFGSVTGYYRNKRRMSRTFTNFFGDLIYYGDVDVIPNTKILNNGGLAIYPNGTDYQYFGYTRLIPEIFWPGGTTGATLVIEPPKKKKWLPRLNSKNIGNTVKSSCCLFNDQFSQVFNQTIVNYPTTLPQDYYLSSEKTADLLALRNNTSIETPVDVDLDGDSPTPVIDTRYELASIIVTGSVVKSSLDDFLQLDYTSHTLKEFCDEEQSNLPTPNYGPLELRTPFSSKQKIKLSFPIKNSTQMPPTTSSIYYFNKREQAWRIPANSTYQVIDFSTYTKTSNKDDFNTNLLINLNNELGDVINVNTGSTPQEDNRGFNSIGMFTISGSNPLRRYYTYDTFVSNVQNLLAPTSSFEKSITNNADYYPNDDEIIEFQSDVPFLVEGIKFELPIEAGNGWFADQTQCAVTTLEQSNTVPEDVYWRAPGDFTGPALTVAIINNVKLNNGTYIRDLIASGTITSANDMNSSYRFEDWHNDSPPVKFLTTLGWQAYDATPPSAIITPNSQNQFTGSVSFETIPMSSHGELLTTGFDGFNIIYNSILLDKINVNILQNNTAKLMGINPAIRNKTNISCGRSIFGNDNLALKTNNGKYEVTNLQNPNRSIFPITSSSEIESYFPDIRYSMIFNWATHNPSPYLLMPGDKLSVSVSKMRPVISKSFNAKVHDYVSFFPNNNGHDIKLSDGQLNITFYGSYLCEEKPVQLPCKQNFITDNISLVIGDDPVVDQYDIWYPGEYEGSYTDNIITGSMLAQNTNNMFYEPSGSRALACSKNKAAFTQTLALNATMAVITNNAETRLQPWFERAGMNKVLRVICDEERYYDSITPDIQSIMQADGVDIVINFPIFQSKGVNIIQLGCFSNSNIYSSYKVNPDWTLAFPFENRYANCTRISSQQTTFNSKYQNDLYLNTTSSPVISEINARKGVQTFICYYNENGGDTLDILDTVQNLIVNEYGAYVSSNVSNLSETHLLKTFFGFGDNNTRSMRRNYNDTATVATGDNNRVEFRRKTVDTLFAGYFNQNYNYYNVPMIRGWKYGLISATPYHTSQVVRRSHHGFIRDVLEQRPFTTFFTRGSNGTYSKTMSPVTVRFVDSTGKRTKPENTWSQNLSTECTSSVPYIDGETRNRTDPDINQINAGLVFVSNDDNNNLVV